jgi:hypothetical protein
LDDATASKELLTQKLDDPGTASSQAMYPGSIREPYEARGDEIRLLTFFRVDALDNIGL